MKRPLLDLVQSLLSSMDSDEVNSISDTVESLQVATLIRDVYYDTAVELSLDQHKGLFQLVASNDPVKEAITMTVPSHVTEVDWVKYNHEPIAYVAAQDFLTQQQSMRNDTTKVADGTVTFALISNSTGEEFSIPYRTDLAPTCFTSFDDDKVVFNSINLADNDTTLQNSKTTCFGSKYSDFLMEDTFVPDLDARNFPYLLNRAKVRAFAELKQSANKEAASETRSQKLAIRRLDSKIEGLSQFETIPKYGR